MMKTLNLFLLIILSTVCSPASAEDADTLQVELNVLNVTARHNSISVAPGHTTYILKKEDIKMVPVASIDGLLEQLPGADIRTRGTGGTQADISWRGGTFDQAIVMLNGVNITDPQTGHYNLDLPVDVSDIERIEILQGTQALLAGINPFSGAINFVTAKTNTNNIRVQLTAGSFGTYTQNFSANAGGQKAGTFLSATNRKSKGYKPNTDYASNDFFSQTLLRTSNAGRFDMQIAFQQKKYGAHGFYSLTYPDQYDHTRTLFGALNWNYILNRFQINSHVYYRGHTDRFELFRYVDKTPAWYTGHNYHFNNTGGIKLNLNMDITNGKITAGAEVRNEHILSNVLGNNIETPVMVLFENNAFYTKQDNRLLKTAFGGAEITLNKWEISTAGALTHNERFGLNWSGGAGLQYNAGDAIQIFASLNRAFRLPTFTDLYYNSVSQRSNAALMPEFSTTIETGMKFYHEGFRLNSVVFYRKGSNLIDWVKHPDSIVWVSSNLSKVNALGADINASLSFAGRFAEKLTLSYSILTMSKPASYFMSKYVLDYLKHKLNMSFQHKIFKDIKASWNAGFYSREGQYILTQGSTPVSYKPYFTADLRILRSFAETEIFVDIKNLTNTQYADFGGIIQPGININGGLAIKIFK